MYDVRRPGRMLIPQAGNVWVEESAQSGATYQASIRVHRQEKISEIMAKIHDNSVVRRFHDGALDGGIFACSVLITPSYFMGLI